MINDNYIFKYEDKVDNGSVISIKTIQGRYFHIPRNIFILLEENTSKSGRISNGINKEYIFDLYSKGIILKNSELNNATQKSGVRQDGVIILQGSNLSLVLRFFSLFSYARVLTLYLFFAFVFSIYFYNFKEIVYIISSVPVSVSVNIDILKMLLLYVFVSGLVHEIGHSSLLYKYQGKKAKIGITFNYCFPAFFADVRDSALLTNKNKKLSILSAGVFYQIIFFPMIIFPFYLWKGDIAVVLLFYILLLQVFFNLIPFLKNDGYWIYREVFSIQERKKIIHIVILRLLLILGISYFIYMVVLAFGNFYVNVILNDMGVLEQPVFDIFRQFLVSAYVIVGFYKYISQTVLWNKI